MPVLDALLGHARTAGRAIQAYETDLNDAMINGADNLPGLRDMEHLTILAGEDNPAREGLVLVVIKGGPSVEVVTLLNAQGFPTPIRKADHYSGTVLSPLGLTDCIRLSLCHCNTIGEVAQLPKAIGSLGE